MGAKAIESKGSTAVCNSSKWFDRRAKCCIIWTVDEYELLVTNLILRHNETTQERNVERKSKPYEERMRWMSQFESKAEK